MTARLFPCMVCEKRYAELEGAEVCERSHQKPVDLMDALRRSLESLQRRESAQSADAVDPHVAVPGTLSSREKNEGRENGRAS